LNIQHIVKLESIKEKKTVSFIVFLSVIAYLVFQTGIHGDDYIIIENLKDKTFLEFLFPGTGNYGLMLFNLGAYYLFWPTYSIIGGDYLVVYDVIKAISISISIYLVYKFALDYLPANRAFLAAIIFVLYPLHDTTIFWYATLPYVLMPSVLMYAHHLIRRDSLYLGTVLLLFGSFMYYGSPPYIFGLAVIFLFEREIKKASIFIVSGMLYVTYYFGVKLYTAGIENRINQDQNILSLMKSLVIQVVSFIESAIGPSYWIKVFYSISSISFISLIIASSVIISFIYFLRETITTRQGRPVFSKSLFLGLTTILLLSFGMFALTGMYNHSAFNLGNRTTVYGSLLIAFLLVFLLPINKKSIIFISIIFVLPVFGLSDHWKSWNVSQKALLENIRHNKVLGDLPESSTLVVVGNTYSKLGPFSHIELLSMPWTVGVVFNGVVEAKNAIALTSYTTYTGNKLVDLKYNQEYPLTNNIYIYDSNQDYVDKILIEDIPKVLLQKPKELRHWLLLLKDTIVQDGILWLSPRLRYLFL